MKKKKKTEKILKKLWYNLLDKQINVLLFLWKETAVHRNFIKIKWTDWKYAMDLVNYGLSDKESDFRYVDKALYDENDRNNYSYRLSSQWITLMKEVADEINKWWFIWKFLPRLKEWWFAIAIIISIIALFK